MGIRNFLSVFAIIFLISTQVYASSNYKNHLRTNFLNNLEIIYAINIRTFNASDVNDNGIIDFDEGEISGNFQNAVYRLDELKEKGITALHILPITPIGKTKALGTAGSLYAASGFNSINPQLKSPNSDLPLEEQAKKFIQEAHNRGIAVIIDVPACGAYDLFLKRPELFIKDSTGQPHTPSDWTDVRLFDAGNENKINMDVLNLYKEFVDMIIRLGGDGIRADVAHSKPAKFWKELIEYSRKKDPEFLWLAESSDSWKDAVSTKAVFTPWDKLLKAGFDGYYGSYFNLKNWKNASDFKKQINHNLALEKIIGEKKSVIGSFTTHDELSPILVNGINYSEMILWLNSTLPINAYYVDGFDSGDNYIYFWANKKATKTFTDDDYYFVHRGKIDIFNFSRKPGGKNEGLVEDFTTANKIKLITNNILKTGEFKFINTSNPAVFAYTIKNSDTEIVVIGNLNFKESMTTVTKIPKYNENIPIIPINIINSPIIEKGKIISQLYPGEIQVFIIESVYNDKNNIKNK